MKPTLAQDAILDEVSFPCVVQPKIDGVRALNFTGRLTGRSLDEFEGFGISDYFSRPDFVGLDGEMILGNVPNSTERLCSVTTGAMGRIYEEGNKKKLITEMADMHWWVFDHLPGLAAVLSYEQRYQLLTNRVIALNHPRIHLIPSFGCCDMAALKEAIARFAGDGYEGTIIRHPKASYKQGRSTKRGQELWRVKPWADAEILVTGITEGNPNQNAKTTNSLGRGERSSANAGMVPNGQVGSIQGTLLADFHDSLTGKLLFAKGLAVTVSSGAMSVKEAEQYFRHPNEIVGHIVKFQHMTHGVKDQPRFPGYMSHRLPQDLS